MGIRHMQDNKRHRNQAWQSLGTALLSFLLGPADPSGFDQGCKTAQRLAHVHEWVLQQC